MSLASLLVFFKIGFLSFGGGWTTVGLIEADLVGGGFLTAVEFSRAVSIAQMTPGPIALNLATYVGYRLGGFPGAALHTLALLMAPLLIVWIAGALSRKIPLQRSALLSALQTITAILLTSTLFSLLQTPVLSGKWGVVLIGAVAFFVFLKAKIDPVLLIFLCGGAGIALGFAGML
ncbi:MAG TPA: chromate transporter [Thermotogota bacterium]|nr:chromate transporter [Thermotogota bacterium]HRW93238.1 chromate transporter [Thermotogota bacterium]